MKRYYPLAILATVILASCATPISDPWKREFNVRVGPERVFDRPVSEVVPELEGARATGNNGRLGSAFVYWGYELADSSPVYLYGCGLFEGHYCDEALPRLCAVGQTTVLSREVQPGKVTHSNCRIVGMAAPGELNPNCTETERENDILVGLASCQ